MAAASGVLGVSVLWDRDWRQGQRWGGLEGTGAQGWGWDLHQGWAGQPPGFGGALSHPSTPQCHPSVRRSLPEAEGSVDNDSFEVAESQALMSRLQWDGSSDISPSDSASSKASE